MTWEPGGAAAGLMSGQGSREHVANLWLGSVRTVFGKTIANGGICDIAIYFFPLFVYIPLEKIRIAIIPERTTVHFVQTANPRGRRLL